MNWITKMILFSSADPSQASGIFDLPETDTFFQQVEYFFSQGVQYAQALGDLLANLPWWIKTTIGIFAVVAVIMVVLRIVIDLL